MDIVSCIEHTNLTPDITVSDVDRLVEEAVLHNFYSVCIPPFWVKRAKREIASHKVRVSTVVGFPFGYQMTETKTEEIRHAVANGADEIGLVMNLSSFKTGYPWTKIEVAKCSHFVHENETMLNVIIETSYLSYEEIDAACKLCVNAGADSLQPLTGLTWPKDIVGLIAAVKRNVPVGVGIKVSGEVESLDKFREIRTAGATRIGTPHGISIFKEQHSKPYIHE